MDDVRQKVERIDAAIPAPPQKTDPDELFGALIERVRKYHPSADLSVIRKAYDVARGAHREQLRKSGEPYIIHPLNVALILADLELDKEAIVGGILHDVVEDTELTQEVLMTLTSQEL